MTPVGMLALYAAVASGVVVLLLLLAGKLSPKKPSPMKLASYALVAMLFLIFDVESLFFYPWAVQIRELKWVGLTAMGGFFAVLGVGYIYARGRGALIWNPTVPGATSSGYSNSK